MISLFLSVPAWRGSYLPAPGGLRGGPAMLAVKQGLGWTDPASALAAAKLSASQDRLFARLASEFGGVAEADPYSLGGGSSAAVRGFEAPDRKIAWCAAVAVREAGYGEDGAASGQAGSSLTDLSCWCTPAVETPNLYVRAGLTGGRLALEIDFRPRLNAAFQLAGVEPTSRDEFAQVYLGETGGARR